MAKLDNTRKWAVVVSILLMLSKVFGFIREVLIANRFGASQESDLYYAATNGIIIVMGILGSGLQTTLVPIFTDIKRERGREGKNKFFASITSVTLLIATLLIALVFIFARPYVRILAAGYEGELHDIVVYLVRLGLPMVLFLCFTYISNAYLQSDEVYGPHALMGIPYNFIFIIYLLVVKRPTITGLMIITLIASSSQFLIQIPALRERRAKFYFSPSFKDENVLKTFRLVLPVILSSAVYQLNMLIDKSLASTLSEGSMSALTYASKVNTMVISVFVVAITSVVFPKLANAVSNRDELETGRLFSSSLNLVALVVIPSCVGMMILAKPIVEILFQRGRFDELATTLTSGALLYYAPGLVGQSFRMPLENMYYSIKDTKTPMITGIVAVLININFNFILIKFMAHRGLALATSISSIASSIILYIVIRKKLPFNELKVLINLLKIAVASSIMGIFTKLIYSALIRLVTGRMAMAVVLFVTIFIAILIYVVSAVILKVEDTDTVIAILKSKLTRRK